MSHAARVQLIDSPLGFASLASECDEIAHRMQPRSPFATSRWLSTWWAHYQENRALVRDRFYVHTVRDRRGALLAVAPLMLTERPATGPLRSRSMSFFGGVKNVTELRGLVCAPEAEERAVSALLQHFDTQGADWDWFTWNGVRKGSAAYAALSASKHFQWASETTDYVLPLAPSWEEFLRGRSRNIKESLRKCYNSLKRDGHSFNFRVVTAQPELPAALRKFFALHACRASSANPVRHADVFAPLQARRMLFDLAANPSEALSLHVFQLEIAGGVVASRLGFVLGEELYLYFSGYEPAWGAYSVMTTTVAETLKWAIERDFKLVNLSPGTDVSKTRWGATGIDTANGVLVSPKRRAKVLFGMLTELNERSQPGTVLGKFLERARRFG